MRRETRDRPRPYRGFPGFTWALRAHSNPGYEWIYLMTEIRVPTLGESVTEATIGKWFKKPGDPVAVDAAAARPA